MPRELATIRTIRSIEPIPGADAIECAHLDGWQVVVRRDSFHAGENVVFFEIDSVLPLADERFAFLSRTEGQQHHRLRSVRLRGCLSQGLALPISEFSGSELESGDIATALGVTLHEAVIPESTNGRIIGEWPGRYASKTDAERAQNLPPEWFTRAGSYVASEKIDGSSTTIIRDYEDNSTIVCSRSWQIEDGDNVYWNAARVGGFAARMDGYRSFVEADGGARVRCLAVQFEAYGSGVQGNPLAVSGLHAAAFDAWLNGKRIPVGDVVPEEFCAPRLPEFDGATASAQRMIAAADGLRSAVNPLRQAEGIVWRRRSDGGDVVKAISNSLLLKQR